MLGFSIVIFVAILLGLFGVLYKRSRRNKHKISSESSSRPTNNQLNPDNTNENNGNSNSDNGLNNISLLNNNSESLFQSKNYESKLTQAPLFTSSNNLTGSNVKTNNYFSL